MKQIKGGVTAAKGFEAASTAAGIKYKNRKRFSKIIFVIIIALLLPYAAEFFDISAFRSSESVEISVPMGSSVRDIAGILKEEKLIKSETIFLHHKILSMVLFKNGLTVFNNVGIFPIQPEVQPFFAFGNHLFDVLGVTVE